MKYLIAIIFFLFLFINCDYYPKTDYLYNPEKAGVKIIGKFNFSLSEDGWHYISFCEKDSNFFFLKEYKIYVYEKKSMNKITEINFDIKSLFPTMRSISDFYCKQGIAVLQDKIYISSWIKPTYAEEHKIVLLSMDLLGNNLKIVDVSSDFGITDSKNIQHFGYNKKLDRLWFVISNNDNSNLVEYSYDINLKKYIKITENNDSSPFCFDGREIFTISKFYRIGAGRSDNFIYKRNLDNFDNINKTINLNYLGEKVDNSEALGVLYNEDYLWVILKRKLLKLEIL